MALKRKMFLAMVSAGLVGGVAAFCTPSAMAQCGGGGMSFRFGGCGSSYGGYQRYVAPSRHYSARRTPVYHAPSVHLDRVYHQDSLHWTPRGGVHGHGHYDVVPHRVPGHIDTLHRGHIDRNPRFHH